MKDAELRQQCHTVLPGQKQLTPAQSFAAMASWCEANRITADVYGEGDAIQALERKVADLLGFESAVFCITGTMTQVTALRLACMDRNTQLVALHPTAHILKHERGNHQLLNAFHALQIGSPHRPFTLEELKAIPDRLGAVSIELPAREIGGQAPSWEELDAFKAWARETSTHLHMDGARLWEAAAGYGRAPKDVAAGFDSVYISLYKGIGGMGGAILAGSKDFTARAAEWFKRQGGNVFTRTPYVVAAAMQIDQRLAAMPACFERTQQLYAMLRGYPLLVPNPAQPQANMLHIHMPVDRERALEIRNQIAEEHGIWLFNYASHAALPGHCYTEWYVGDLILGLSDEKLQHALNLWHAAMAREVAE